MALCLLDMTLLGGFLALPTLFAELFIYSQHHDIAVLPPPTDPAAFAPRPGAPLGTVVGRFWLVQQIAPGTYAIGEPANAPDNYEYLRVASRRYVPEAAAIASSEMFP